MIVPCCCLYTKRFVPFVKSRLERINSRKLDLRSRQVRATFLGPPATGRIGAVQLRFFSEDATAEGDYMILYERNGERNKIPRAAFAVGLFNTTYWTWYSLDFIPAVNASHIEALHVDPTIGYIGVALGLLVNSATVLYPLATVSKLAFSPSRNNLRVWIHDLPWIQPSKKGMDYSLGDLTLDPSSSDVKRIFNKMDGDIRQYKGHLGMSVKGRRFPYLLDIQQKEDVRRPKLMLQALIKPDEIIRQENRGSPLLKKQQNAKPRSLPRR